MMTSASRKSGCLIKWLSSVVLPLPKNPDRTQTGTRLCAGLESVVILTVLQFAAFLGFEAETGSRAGQQSGNTDRLAGFLAPAIFTCLDSGQGLIDFLEQL